MKNCSLRGEQEFSDETVGEVREAR